MTRWSAALGAAVIVALWAAPAAAQDRPVDRDDLVVLTGEAEVAEGESIDTLVIFDGPAVVDGTVREAAVAFNGPVTISGLVEGDVVSFNGVVTLEPGAEVGGDIVSRLDVRVAEGATVGGEIRREPFEFYTDPFRFISRILAWIAVSVSVLILGLLLLLLAPRGMEAIDHQRPTMIGPAIAWGILLFLGLPILAFVAFLTLVGIPFGAVLLMALGLLYGIGYTVTAWVVGRAILGPPRPSWISFLAGWGILRVIALVPVLGGLAGTVATLFGLGAVVVAAWRARRVPSAAPA